MDKTVNPVKPAFVVPRVKTPDAVKDHAFDLWVKYGRSWTAVARKLDCEEKTVRRWAHADNWEERRQAELASALPGMNPESDTALVIAKHYASIRLQQIAYQAAEEGTVPNHKEVDALTRIVDRGNAVLATATSKPHHADLDLHSLTDAELLALEDE